MNIFLMPTHLSSTALKPHGRDDAHQSVMIAEVLKLLEPKKGEVVVDATYGQGGHSRMIAAAAKVTLVAIDADPAAGVSVANFADLSGVLKKLNIKKSTKRFLTWGGTADSFNPTEGFHSKMMSRSI